MNETDKIGFRLSNKSPNRNIFHVFSRYWILGIQFPCTSILSVGIIALSSSVQSICSTNHRFNIVWLNRQTFVTIANRFRIFLHFQIWNENWKNIYSIVWAITLYLWDLHATARLLNAAAVAVNWRLFVYSQMADWYSLLRKYSLPLSRCLWKCNK